MVKPGIHFKLDWFTAMFYDCSIDEVVGCLGFEVNYDLKESYSSAFCRNFAYGNCFTFTLDNISLFITVLDVYRTFNTEDLELIDPVTFFSSPIPSIRLDLSGSSLNQLRARGVDVDYFFKIPFDVHGKEYHVTRADFAFDLVDYCPEFLDNCLRACNFYHNSNNLLYTASGGRAIKYSMRLGDQKTLYLGSKGSEKLLRIYDKRLEYEQAHRLCQCPYNEDDNVPSSWIRVELQSRDGSAQSLLYDSNDYLEVFRFIFDKFSIRTGPGMDSPICKEWVDLFDWNTIPRIIQNANTVHYESISERAGKYIRNIAFSNIVIHLADVGIDNFIFEISSELDRLQKSPYPLDHRRWCSLLCKLNYMYADNSFPDHLSYDTSKGVYRLQ